jgi:hypothetical protein
MLRILCIGDIVGRPGREAIQSQLGSIKTQYNIDFTVANIENSASGFGFTRPVYNELCNRRIDAFTSGNHVFDKKDVLTASFGQLIFQAARLASDGECFRLTPQKLPLSTQLGACLWGSRIVHFSG